MSLNNTALYAAYFSTLPGRTRGGRGDVLASHRRSSLRCTTFGRDGDFVADGLCRDSDPMCRFLACGSNRLRIALNMLAKAISMHCQGGFGIPIRALGCLGTYLRH